MLTFARGKEEVMSRNATIGYEEMEGEVAGRRLVAEAAGVASEALAERLLALGFRAETVILLDVIPAVEVAWADGLVSGRERKALVGIAAERGVYMGSRAHGMLLAMLEEPPCAPYFAEARDVLTLVVDAMPEMEANMRRAEVIDYCREVAEASGSLLARLGLGDATSEVERAAIDRVTARFGRRWWELYG